MRRWLGLKDLVHDAVEQTTNLVQETQEAAADRTVRALSLIEPLGEAARAVAAVHRMGAGVVFDAIRGINRGVQILADAGIALAGGPPEEAPSRAIAVRSVGWWADIAQSALNAAGGDFLRQRDNALAIRMSLRRDGAELVPEREALALALPDATAKVCLFVHGLGCNEWEWEAPAGADSFGTLLARDLGVTPLYLRYNSGLRVSRNGRELSRLLAQLLAAYPRSVEEIVLIGHSMGGLVVRSAAHYGGEEHEAWVSRLRHVVCIGSPHLGAPLEKGANLLASVLGMFDTAGTQVPARILNARSVGIKDLRFGYVVDEDWLGEDPDAFLADNRRSIPFIDGATYCFVAASVTRDESHPLGRLVGDMLVRLPSAAGRARDPARRIPFPLGRVFSGMHHLELQRRPEVYAAIRAWLRGDATSP